MGRQTAPRARARLGLDLAQRISGVRSDPTDERPFREDQNPGRGRRPGTLAISALALSLSFLSRSSEDSRYRAAASEESRAGGLGEPWRRRRPPRRRMCSPTGEHAAVERPGRGASLAEPGEPAPPARLLLPRRRRFIRRTLTLTHFPLSDFEFVLFGFIRMGKTRVRVRVRSCRFDFFAFVSFFSFIRMENWD